MFIMYEVIDANGLESRTVNISYVTIRTVANKNYIDFQSGIILTAISGKTIYMFY